MRTRYVVVSVVIISVVLGIWFSSTTRADIGGNVIPVNCMAHIFSEEIGTNVDFDCQTANGDSFTGVVPEGKYVLITGVTINKLHAPISDRHQGSIRVFPSVNTPGRIYGFDVPSETTFVANYTSPVLVAGPEDALRVYLFDGTSTIVYLSGLITTDPSLVYVPLIAKQ